MNKRVYISGPISNFDLSKQKRIFALAAICLKQDGYEPVNPFDNGLPDEASYHDHMKADIQMLLSCNYIYLLDGWEHSEGARLEKHIAEKCGIKQLNCNI